MVVVVDVEIFDVVVVVVGLDLDCIVVGDCIVSICIFGCDIG